MRKLIVILTGGVFALLPLIMLVSYLTYTEKIIAPIIIVLCMLSLICLKVENKKGKSDLK